MPIEVLIADDQAALLASLKGHWQKALGDTMRYDMTHDLDHVAQKLKLRPHIVIVDNQFAAASNEGATFIANQKSMHPDTIFVLMTGEGFDIDQLGQRTPNPDFIVPKPSLLTTRYREYIGSAVRNALTRTSALVSTPDEGLGEIGITVEAFRSLVEQCVYTLKVFDYEVQKEPRASFQLLSGGFSGAAVYQMTIRGAGGSPALPLVLKCGKRDQIERETRAFERWVRWQLPHDMRVDVIGRGATGDHAAVCYGFVLGSSEKLTSLADSIRSKQIEEVEANLRRIYFAGRTGWYRPVREASDSLCGYLLDRFEFDSTKDERRNKRLHSVLSDVSKRENFDYNASAGEYVVLGRQFSPIRRALAASVSPPARLVYCHGDLNASNIFVEPVHGGLALIDFEQSGENHIFRDLISNETSIRMELPATLTETVNFEGLVVLERSRFDRKPEVRDASYLSWIEMVRSIGIELFPDAADIHYLIPLVLHSWKVLGIKSWDYEVERRLAAVILAGIECIQER